MVLLPRDVKLAHFSQEGGEADSSSFTQITVNASVQRHLEDVSGFLRSAIRPSLKNHNYCMSSIVIQVICVKLSQKDLKQHFHDLYKKGNSTVVL